MNLAAIAYAGCYPPFLQPFYSLSVLRPALAKDCRAGGLQFYSPSGYSMHLFSVAVQVRGGGIGLVYKFCYWCPNKAICIFPLLWNVSRLFFYVSNISAFLIGEGNGKAHHMKSA